MRAMRPSLSAPTATTARAQVRPTVAVRRATCERERMRRVSRPGLSKKMRCDCSLIAVPMSSERERARVRTSSGRAEISATAPTATVAARAGTMGATLRRR